MPPTMPIYTIVIVDDTPAIVELIVDLLSDDPNYQAVAARDGPAALALLARVQADLVILDLDLPGLSGLEVYDRLHADPVRPPPPVLFITANGGNLAFQQRQFPHYLAKPFDLDDLLAWIAHLLGQRPNAPQHTPA